MLGHHWPHQIAQYSVMDFEKTISKGIQFAFPDVEVKGCAFHWIQVVWRKVQDLGLGTS